ncbi:MULTISPECIES: PTS sugar transporter subunit IIA [Breznakia]|uniref:PTS system mannose-specific IIA component n=1 Tax=Breznakia blatticola TaxID=1754012 RepID=A0A4R8A7D5_9FIRM|nr:MULTISPECIES: PTS sugar transporter subunit IIA [Breznakia]MDH6368061.1 PTS system mannose-specific IIA component [Breznakia sp. PH1-1]MDH6405149.1 PTS system mannose-specific IIA component [Breznakia sp. PF1-11]MDH6412862.1 PTS system mannose-specific IIA component [Breznakia sp. PFB1-11]MDH6415225.1 PTS system mannose-specific IIA component [Breznakia sp. PFB1-14]MDH6417533.1 PTS system mannose-specific IIA component [Breznakia sp. PFB1-4]
MKFILVSHGSFAKGLVESSQMIAGQQENLVSFGLYPEDDINDLKNKIETEFLKSEMDNIVFFTDLFHGSPFNAVVSLMGKYDIYHITGMNLPLILEALMARMNEDITPAELCKSLLANANNTIIDVKECLKEAN